MTEGGNLSGWNSRGLKLTNINSSNSGSYSVIVSNMLGSVTSAPAVPVKLTVYPT